ncbi:glycosyl hydrolase family 28-related protein [Propionibacteriaceae bacterium Y2011]
MPHPIPSSNQRVDQDTDGSTLDPVASLDPLASTPTAPGSGRRGLLRGLAAGGLGLGLAAMAHTESDAAPGRTRWQQEALGRSVIEDGATGDGATDDTAAIQETIRVVSAAGGGMVRFPAGRYAISQTLEVTEDNVVLVGEGAASRILRLNSNAAFTLVRFACDGTRAGRLWNVGVKDVAIGGGNVGQPDTPGEGALTLFGVSQFDVTGCYIEQPGGPGLTLQDSYIGTITHNKTRFCDDGLVLVGVSNALKITGNRFQINNGHGIRGPELGDSPLKHWSQMMGVVIEANDIEGNGEDGIHFGNCLHMGISVIGNYFELNHNPSRTKTGNGPHIYKVPHSGRTSPPDEFQGVTINGNFLGNRFPAPDNDSIVLEHGSQIVMLGNAYWTGSAISPRDAIRVAPQVTRWMAGPGVDGALQADGNVSVTDGGAILTSPNGTRFTVTVNDDGELTTTKL